MTRSQKIYCAGCGDYVQARLTDGAEVYPHRPDLFSLPFWKCDSCNGTVGCHHKTKNRTNPMGCIATPEMKQLRMMLHGILDPIWKTNRMTRSKVYQLMSDEMGFKFHTGQLRSKEECEKALRAAQIIFQGSGDE